MKITSKFSVFHDKGFKVTFDVSKSAGARVSRLLIKEGSTRPFPAYAEVEDDQLYNIVMTNYLSEGGDGYSMIAEKKKHQIIGVFFVAESSGILILLCS